MTDSSTMTDSDKAFAAHCAREDPHAFYIWSRWLAVRAVVLDHDKHECQRCKTLHHKYTPATTVHHVNHFKKRPDLALEMWYRNPATHEQERNLISLCHACHEEVHGYRKRNHTAPLTEECWD